MAKNKKLQNDNGADVKILQYSENAKTVCHDKIDLHALIEKHLIKQQVGQCCVMVNLEKDHERYNTTVKELEKISFKHFVHLRGTYWKNKIALEQNLSNILQFLVPFNPAVVEPNVSINDFSETTDPKIEIQDGPLACYCSHLRAMMYGWKHFPSYTIIIEDDIEITNAKNIEKYLQCIPDDWDVVCLNSIPQNDIYDNQPWYKFTTDFHSTHFYIVKNSSFPSIFGGMYPVVDQVDVLLSNLKDKLNIYNIVDTVYQRNIETNTQNNLHIIFTSPNYEYLCGKINEFQDMLNVVANRMLSKNKKRNKNIIADIMYDVVYRYVLNHGKKQTDHENLENYLLDTSKMIKRSEWEKFVYLLGYFIRCTKKGVNHVVSAEDLMTVILHTIYGFRKHGKYHKAYAFGATSHVYVAVKKNSKKIASVIKCYNEKLRWITEGHDDSKEIFNKEIYLLSAIQHLKHVPKLQDYNAKKRIIHLSYCGESLYSKFVLPKNWSKQIVKIFDEFTKNKIYYPEFRLQNILVLKGKITFVDFGLAVFDEKADNTENCEKFIKYLDILNERLKDEKNKNTRHQLITTFLRNTNVQ